MLKRAPMDELRILPDEDEVNEVPGNGVVLIGNSELYERVKKGENHDAGLHAHWTAAGLQHDAG